MIGGRLLVRNRTPVGAEVICLAPNPLPEETAVGTPMI